MAVAGKGTLEAADAGWHFLAPRKAPYVVVLCVIRRHRHCLRASTALTVTVIRSG